MKESFAFIRDTRQYQPNYQPRSMRITCPSGDVFVVLGTEQMRVALWQHVRTQNQWRYALYRTPKPLIECFDRLFKDGQAN